MSYPRLTEDLDIVQKLDDEPNDVGGLSAAELKAKFDEGPNAIKDYINSTLLPAFESESGAESTGIEAVPGLTGATNVQEAIAALVLMIQTITQGAVADGSITTAKLSELAVTTAKLAASSVTEAKLANSSVTTGKIADTSVNADKLATNSVSEAKIASGAVTEGKIGSGAVTHAKIGAAAVGTDNIDSYAVTETKLAGSAITEGKIATGAVTAPKIADGAVTTSFSATITTTWTGSAAPYSQVISVPGLLATDSPMVDMVPSDTYATAEAQLEDYGKIYRMVAGADTLTVYATEPTEVAITIQIKAVRK